MVNCVTPVDFAVAGVFSHYIFGFSETQHQIGKLNSIMKSLNQFIRQIVGRPYKERVVYSCMFGFSEAFKDRNYPEDADTDYICFTDDRNLESETWRFVVVDTTLYGPQKTSKLVKLCPHLFLSDYKTSLYVDNTVRINSPLNEIFFHLSSIVPFVTYRHDLWDCAYTESDAVIEAKYADPRILKLQIENYERDGLPRHAGLYHSAILLRNHNHRGVKKFGDLWFREIQKYSYRDQVALSYLAWKYSFKLHVFDGYSTDDNLVFWPEDVGPRLPRGFVDDEYLHLNPDLDLNGMTPREHFLKIGSQVGLAWRQ